MLRWGRLAGLDHVVEGGSVMLPLPLVFRWVFCFRVVFVDFCCLCEL